jgi:hypothetical protein
VKAILLEWNSNIVNIQHMISYYLTVLISYKYNSNKNVFIACGFLMCEKNIIKMCVHVHCSCSYSLDYDRISGIDNVTIPMFFSLSQEKKLSHPFRFRVHTVRT